MARLGMRSQNVQNTSHWAPPEALRVRPGAPGAPLSVFPSYSTNYCLSACLVPTDRASHVYYVEIHTRRP